MVFEESAGVLGRGKGGFEEFVIGLMNTVLGHANGFVFRRRRGCLLLSRLGAPGIASWQLGQKVVALEVFAFRVKLRRWGKSEASLEIVAALR